MQLKRFTFYLSFVCVLLVNHSCGGAGTSGGGSAVSAAGLMRGAVVGSDGDQSNLVNWVVVAMERDTGISRVALVDAAGIFNLRNVNFDRAHTLVLLTADYKFKSVLSMSGIVDGTIRQYFMPQTNLPKLVHRSEIVTFFSEEGLQIENDYAVDSDQDGIPEGKDPDALALALNGVSQGVQERGLSLMEGALNDFDKDGIPDIQDADIDSDGLANWIDTDDDGDATVDVFDLDANGNIVNDAQESEGDHFYSEGVEWVAVQVERAVTSSGSVETTLTINTKLREGVTPLAIDVRGAPSLFGGATINNITTNDEGVQEIIPSAWDRRLMDDGLSNDGIAGDRIWGRKVVLLTGKLPKSEHMIFVRLAFGNATSPWFMEFPYTFPKISIKNISITYDSTLKRVTLVGNPYDTNKAFIWFVDVVGTITELVDGVEVTKEGIVSQSSLLYGNETTSYVLSTDDLEAGQTYKVLARAQAYDKVPSYPAYVVKTKQTEITFD